MIILAAGMPRAGSGWHYNLTRDLMQLEGYQDTCQLRQTYHLQKILTEVNCNIGVLSLRRMGMILVPALAGNNFVIKAHAGPTKWSRLLMKYGWLRVTYIYRDPRDAMLSAYEYGRRSVEKGRPNFFSQFDSFEKTLDFMSEYVRIWDAWMQEKGVMSLKYEDLLTNYDAETSRLVAFLGVSPEKAQEVIERYRPANASTAQKGLHFFKGKIGRFRDAYSQEEQEKMNARFGDALQRMGYPR